MSNRTTDQISEAAAWRACYLRQIEILTDPKLSDREKVERFAEAAGYERERAVEELRSEPLILAVWRTGDVEHSLFADLPGCGCPVIECSLNGRFAEYGIPFCFDDIHLTRECLTAFMNVQMDERFGREG